MAQLLAQLLLELLLLLVLTLRHQSAQFALCRGRTSRPTKVTFKQEDAGWSLRGPLWDKDTLLFLVVGQDTFHLGQNGALHGFNLTPELHQLSLLVPEDHQELLHHICGFLEDKRGNRFAF